MLGKHGRLEKLWQTGRTDRTRDRLSALLREVVDPRRNADKKFYEKYLRKAYVTFQMGLQGAIIVNGMLAGKG